MNQENNPYASAAGGYSVSTQYGAANGDGGKAAAVPEIKDVTTASFAADVIQESRKQPVLVDFWAPWFVPC